MGIFQIPQDLNRETTFEDHAITDPKSELQFLGNMIMFVFTRDYFNKLRAVGFDVKEVDYTKELLLYL